MPASHDHPMLGLSRSTLNRRAASLKAAHSFLTSIARGSNASFIGRGDDSAVRKKILSSEVPRFSVGMTAIFTLEKICRLSRMSLLMAAGTPPINKLFGIRVGCESRYDFNDKTIF
jgi:hypothetical protein